MDIEDNRSDIEKRFSEIHIGNVFEDGGGGFYMKIGNDCYPNAINLSSGMLVTKEENIVVTPVKAKVVIE